MNWRALLLSLLAFLVMFSGVELVYSRHQHRMAFAQLSELERERDELNIEFDRLQLEIAALADSARIEYLASERLRMRPPVASETVMVTP